MDTDHVSAFCAFYHPYHSISPARRRMQEKALRALADELGGNILSTGTSELQSHLSGLLAGGLAAATVKQRLNALRPFFAWAWDNKLIDAERLMEIQRLRAPRVGEGVPRPYKRAEVQLFWQDVDRAYPWAFDRGGLTRVQGFDRGEYYLRRFERGQSRWSRVQPFAQRVQIEAIASLALYGGLRRDEVFDVELREIDPENDYIVAVGARKNPAAEPRPRPVPWTLAFMRDAVRAWLQLRARLAPEHDRVWLSLHQHHRLKPLRHRQFEVLLSAIGKTSGCRGWEFHRLRHTFATEQLRSGTPLENVRKMLGHSRIEQTLRYAQLLEGDIVHAADKSMAAFTTAVAPREAA